MPIETEFRAQIFSSPKLGNRQQDYEDASACTALVVPANRSARYAIADGATMSFFAGAWAELLVNHFVKSTSPPFPLCSSLAIPQKEWAGQLAAQALPWYAQRSIVKGAFSTFLGFWLHYSLLMSGSGWWTAIAIGDACLFQIRDDSLICCFPLEASVEFSNTPHLIGSRSSIESAQTLERYRQREWQAGDRFVIATDAFSHWFLHSYESAEKPWRNVARLADEGDSAFEDWLNTLRNSGAMKNDDLTIIIIDIVAKG